jgi:glutamine synthetase adenylyltransferase
VKDKFKRLVRAAPNPERARQYLQRWQEAGADVDALEPDLISALSLVFSVSPFLSEQLIAHPDWWGPLSMDYFRFGRKAQGLEREVSRGFSQPLAAGNYSEAFSVLRRFQQRELFRIGVRDLARLGPTPEIILELSDLADVCLTSAQRAAAVTPTLGPALPPRRLWPLAAHPVRRHRPG